MAISADETVPRASLILARFLKPHTASRVTILVLQVISVVAGLAPFIAVAEIGRVLPAGGPVGHVHVWTVVALGVAGLLVRLLFSAASIGPSDGKSTVDTLLPRFFDPAEGSVSLRGADLCDAVLPTRAAARAGPVQVTGRRVSHWLRTVEKACSRPTVEWPSRAPTAHSLN